MFIDDSLFNMFQQDTYLFMPLYEKIIDGKLTPPIIDETWSGYQIVVIIVGISKVIQLLMYVPHILLSKIGFDINLRTSAAVCAVGSVSTKNIYTVNK